jgi:hypothetical protein
MVQEWADEIKHLIESEFPVCILYVCGFRIQVLGLLFVRLQRIMGLLNKYVSLLTWVCFVHWIQVFNLAL